MNRAERRKVKKRMKGQNIFLEKGGENIDRSKAQYCWLHNLKLDDINNQTERDKKLIESVRLIPYKVYDKNGNVSWGRKCPRCGNTITVKQTLPDSLKENIIITDTENYGNLRLSDMPKQI